jgi:hypothetical protein
MDPDSAYFAWLLAPKVRDGRSILLMQHPSIAQVWGEDSHRVIHDKIHSWYDARPAP